MLRQRDGKWETAALEPPFGRGVMVQVYVDDLAPLLARLSAANWPAHTELREVWRRVGEGEFGQREIFVQDPDGYLLMLAQNIGVRDAGAG